MIKLLVTRVAVVIFLVQITASVVWAEPVNATKKWPNSGRVSQEEYIYLVKEYRYEPARLNADADIGQSICGTRCNAMSADYKNYLDTRGWRLKKVASNNEIVVDLNNPFIKGKCTCVADRYLVTVQDLYMSK